MTSKELNLNLVAAMPEVKDAYYEEITWQDGDNTGSHVVYADVFVPFIKEQILEKDEKGIVKSFNFIEDVLEINDEYANEVIALSVIESLVFAEEIEVVSFINYAKPKTRKLIEETVQSV